MPWRSNPSAYRVWISEVMLQQTQVETVIPYFLRFIRRFPSTKALARAEQQEVLKAWEGLGYYARARNLHAAAQRVVDAGGRLPVAASAWGALPGVGEYTAAAIASIVHGEAVPVIDGNVVRVFSRFWGIAEDVRKPAAHARLGRRLRRAMGAAPPGDFNQAAMELGALVCRSTSPRCDVCPLRQACKALRLNRIECFPVKPTRPPRPHHDIAVGVIYRADGCILIARRRADQMLGGLWEFPGGKRRATEPLEETACREIREETGLRVSVGAEICVVEHAFSHFSITLHAFACRRVSGRPRPLCSQEVKWVRPQDLDRHPFPAANRRILAALGADRTRRRTPEKTTRA